MRPIDLWSVSRRRSATLAAEQGEGNIDDELMLHFRSLVDENLARGMSLESAWGDAQNRFGSLRRYSDECRQIALGEYPMLQKLSAVGITLLSLLVGWMLIEVRSLRQTAFAAAEQQPRQVVVAGQTTAKERRQNEAASAKKNDLRGAVVDRDGKPLADANVLVILKTWLGGRYRQQDFTTKSDRQGEFRLPGLVPVEGKYAVHLSVAKDRYALTSAYQLREEGGKPAPMNFKLGPAAPITFIINDASGRPAPKARVRPVLRRSPKGDEHLVYFQGSESIEKAADDQGRVEMSCFQRGDHAEFQIELPGKKSQRVAVMIPSAGATVTLKCPQDE